MYPGPSSPISIAHHRLRSQPTPSLPNLRAGSYPHRMSSDTPPSSPTIAAPAASELQKHLYASFVEGKTADVSLRIRGSWDATYHLHKVILIQAGFFKSLFTAGFVESIAKFASSQHESPVIDIVFDDPNITRAAFEICIARLYGGGPPIHISPTILPTPAHPLTPTIPFSSVADSIQHTPCPPNHHPTTPRFLLSLLATAVYLSVPIVAAQALSAVLTTIGPRTVLRYLDFATGKGIGEPDEEEPEAAVGLEAIAILATDDDDQSRKASSTYERDSQQVGSPQSTRSESTDHLEIKKEDPANSFSESSCSSASHNPPTSYFYGGVSNKIGEAAVCWITRWAADMLQYEQDSLGPSFARIRQESFIVPPASIPSTRKRATTIPFHSNAPIHRSNPSTSVGIISEGVTAAYDMPFIWRRGGLDARETERYNMARSIVELRRKDGVIQEEESEWSILFEKGIYYANMSFDDMIDLEKHVSSVTGKPYAPLAVLQSAHWDQSMLRHHITFRPASSAQQSPGPPPKELGVSVTTGEIHDQQGPGGDSKLYFPVPEDSSSRLGDSVGLESASMDQLFAPSPMRKQAGRTGVVHTAENNCFGLDQQAYAASACKHEDPKGKGKWTPHPPLRFGVEFWDIDALKEKSRLHSHTIWYAGSLWNVYVQVVRKKGVQLGVYLHRQSTVDPIPPSSAPLPSLAGPAVVATPQPQHVASLARPSSSHSRSSTPSSTPASPSRPSSMPNSYSSVHVNSVAGNTIPATAPPVAPSQPYRDGRGAVSAYFTIACASATGANLTKFTSAPDVFSVSQSWGWKSSSLRTEEYLELSDDGVMKAHITSGKEVSLRATIVLGVV
ncbi:hypothetical protein EUX98_g4025 [Antrodiella citrinella]|uniref:BTB domain-containing protein n=1 Tax=Antrodiella citrinella TaxID=2447956 RepID=A0A4S4MX62_9APHY|nr:hypothetical protein EUX98_g4025 [Antrodiella citrinella]